MKKRQISLILFLCYLLSSTFLQAQTTLAERLGYPKDAKLLIIHADDLAVAHSENQASFKALKDGSVNSASLMVPCPWLPELADYVKKNPNHDLGLHLTVTSEWQWYKWGPVAPRNEVSSLVNNEGYFYDNCNDFAKNANLNEIERELRAQIEKAKAMGIEPTHFDTHMRCLFSDADICSIYFKMSREYGVPVKVTRSMLQGYGEHMPDTTNIIFIDQSITAVPEDYKNGMKAFYTNVLRNLKPGVNELVIHTAYNDAEMQGITVNHPNWGAAWRQADFDFFTSKFCRKILAEEKIQLITWRKVGRLLK